MRSNKRIKVFIGVILVLLGVTSVVVVAFVLSRSNLGDKSHASSTQTAILSLTSKNGSTQFGVTDPVVVSAVMNTGTSSPNVVETSVTFNNSLLTLNSITYDNNVSTTPASTKDDTSIATANTNGRLTLSVYTGDNFHGAAIHLADLNFTAKGTAGTAQFAYGDQTQHVYQPTGDSSDDIFLSSTTLTVTLGNLVTANPSPSPVDTTTPTPTTIQMVTVTPTTIPSPTPTPVIIQNPSPSPTMIVNIPSPVSSPTPTADPGGSTPTPTTDPGTITTPTTDPASIATPTPTTTRTLPNTGIKEDLMTLLILSIGLMALGVGIYGYRAVKR